MQPLNNQVGGDHYKRLTIQPAEFIHANGIGFFEGNAISYICRHKFKNGSEDLQKAIHHLELLLALEYGLTRDSIGGWNQIPTPSSPSSKTSAPPE